MLLVARVRRTVLDRGLIPSGTCVVVGTSGGPDSTALLDVLARLRSELALRLLAVGVDHGLRASAAAELDLADAHAASVQVPFERVRLAPQGGSLQAWARRERYAALARIADRVGASRIAVGHTLDDQAETVLSRLLHGSGLHGLAAIRPARADSVVRPLIDARRSEVRAYLAHEALPFAEDPSNQDARFERVRLRHTVLAALEAEAPDAALHLARIADEAREVDEALGSLAITVRADAGEPLSLAVLRRAPMAVAMRAFRLALGEDLKRAHLTVLMDWIHDPQEGAELRLPGARTARIVEGRIVVIPLGRSDPDEEA